MLVKRAALLEHLENECPCRMQKCGYCTKDVRMDIMEVSSNSARGFQSVDPVPYIKKHCTLLQCTLIVALLLLGISNQLLLVV